MVQVALCTKFGSKLRSNLIYRMIANGTNEIADEKAKLLTPPLPNRSQGRAPNSPALSEWEHIPDQSADFQGYPADPKPKKVATILRSPEVQCWLYGVLLSPGIDLPQFPELRSEDLDVLQPLPGDSTQMTEGPFQGHTFAGIASSAEAEPYCKHVLHIALSNEPMPACVFRLAFYLHARVQIAWRAGLKLSGIRQPTAAASDKKRTISPNDMITNRVIQVPLQYDQHDPASLRVQDCEVMMVDAPDVDDYTDLEAYAVAAAGPSRSRNP